MDELFLFFKNNILLKRIFSIRKSIFTYSLASIIDIFLILIISSIFGEIASESLKGNIFQLFSL